MRRVVRGREDRWLGKDGVDLARKAWYNCIIRGLWLWWYSQLHNDLF